LRKTFFATKESIAVSDIFAITLAALPQLVESLLDLFERTTGEGISDSSTIELLVGDLELEQRSD
jgi:hypothetical protein